MTTRLLVNPAAGGGRADRLQPWVAAQLQRAFGDVDAVHTTSFQNADEALAEFAATDGEGGRVVVMRLVRRLTIASYPVETTHPTQQCPPYTAPVTSARSIRVG